MLRFVWQQLNLLAPPANLHRCRLPCATGKARLVLGRAPSAWYRWHLCGDRGSKNECWSHVGKRAVVWTRLTVITGVYRGDYFLLHSLWCLATIHVCRCDHGLLTINAANVRWGKGKRWRLQMKISLFILVRAWSMFTLLNLNLKVVYFFVIILFHTYQWIIEKCSVKYKSLPLLSAA